MSESLTTPESIIADPKFQRAAAFSDDPTDIVNLIGKLSDIALKNNAEASKERAKGNDQAIKAYTSAMDTRVKGASALTKYIADLGSNDARVRAAAISGIANTTKAQIEAFTKIEKQESGNFHPWFEKARGNALTADGGVRGPGFWTGLVGGVIQEAEISRDNINIPWFVNVVQSKIDHGEIGDWRKMKDKLGDDEYARLERLWATAEEAKRSQADTLHDLESLQQQAEGFSRSNAGATDASFKVARSTLEPLVAKSIQSITGGKSVDDLKNDATHFYDASKVEKLEATADKYNAAAMDLLDSLGYTSKDGASTGGFSVDRWAPWRGSLVNDPKFQTWARERGFTDLGRAQVDEDGKVLSYVRGADDNRAIKAYGRALRLETLDAAGYDVEPVAVQTKLPYASVRSGRVTDADGDGHTIIAVNRGGKQTLYTMAADGSPVPFGNDPRLGANVDEVEWAGEPTAYEEIKGIKDDAAVARAYAAHLKDGSGDTAAVEAPAPAADWTVTVGAYADSDRTTHDIYGVSDGKSHTQWFTRNKATGAFEPTNPVPNAKLGPAMHVSPERVAEFAGKEDGHFALARLADEAVTAPPTEITQGLFLDDAEYAKAAPKVEPKTEVKAGPTGWTPIAADATPASETLIGTNYGTTARDGTQRVRVQGGDTYDVKEGDVVAPLKKEPEYERNRLNAEDRAVNRKALVSENEAAAATARANLPEPRSLGEATPKVGGHPDQAPPKLGVDEVLSPAEIEALAPRERAAYAVKLGVAQNTDVRNKQPDALPAADESAIGDRTDRARKVLDARIKLEEYIQATKDTMVASSPDKRPALQAKLTQYEDAADVLDVAINTTYKDEVNDIRKKAMKVKKSAGVSGPDGLNEFEGAAKHGEGFQATAGAAQREFKAGQKAGTYDSGPVPEPVVKESTDHKPNPPVREMAKEALAKRGMLAAASSGPVLSVRPTTLAASDKALVRANDVEPLSLAGPPVADPAKAALDRMGKDALRNAMKAKYVSHSMKTPLKEGIGTIEVKP